MAKNVAVQLGKPLDFEAMGAGLIQSAPDPFAVRNTLTCNTTNVTRMALSRPLSGSFFLRVEILTRQSAAFNNAALFGVMPEKRRMTYQERRPVNVQYPQNRAPDTPSNGACVLGITNVSEGAAVYASGLGTLVVGDVVWVRYDADTGRVQFIKGADPAVGLVYTSNATYSGPLRFVANLWNANNSISITHGGPALPKMGKFRPGGVWGRVAMWGFMDDKGVWDGSIPKASEPEFEVAAAFRVMGNLGRRSSVGDITVTNRRTSDQSGVRKYDDWKVWELRDEPFTIFRSSGSFDENPGLMTAVARGVVDSVSEPSDGRIALSCRDPGTALDVPWQAAVYPSDLPLTTLRGKKLPTAMGTLWAAPVVQKDTSALLYDIADDALLQDPTAVYDKGVQLTAGVGYSVGTDAMHIRRLTNPEGLMCATVVGGMVEQARIDTAIGDLAGTWSGSPSAPNGWVNGATGTGTVTHTVGVGARLYKPNASGQAALQTNTAQFDASGTYRLDIDIAPGPLSSLGIYRANATGSARQMLGTVQVGTGGLVDTASLFITLPANAYTSIMFRVESTSGEVTIRTVRLSLVTQARTTAHFIRLAACQRGSIPVESLDGSVASYPDTTALCLNTGPDDASTVGQRMDEIMASTVGAYWFDLNGNLCCGRLEDPSTVAQMPVPVINDIGIIGGVTSAFDEAGGLSSRVGADPVWQKHSESDIAGSLNTTGAGRQLADKLKSDYASIVESAARFAGCYKFADLEEPYHTLVSSLGSGQGVANRLGVLYSKPRRVYTVTCNMGSALTIKPCSVVDLEYAGETRRLFVLSVRGRYSTDVATLTLWG